MGVEAECAHRNLERDDVPLPALAVAGAASNAAMVTRQGEESCASAGT
jgi:hypothetical protein